MLDSFALRITYAKKKTTWIHSHVYLGFNQLYVKFNGLIDYSKQMHESATEFMLPLPPPLHDKSKCVWSEKGNQKNWN